MKHRHDQAPTFDPLAAIVQSTAKPDYLLKAEQRLTEARNVREEKAQAAAAARREWMRLSGGSPLGQMPKHLRDLEDDLADAELQVRVARNNLAEAREKFAPTFMSAIGPSVDAAMRELETIAARAYAVTDGLVQAQESAMRNGLTLSGPVARSSGIREATRWLHRALQGGN